MTRTQQKISKNPEKLGSRKMLVVIACVAALFLAGPAASQGSTVKVGFYGEALCPDCIHFINGPLTHAFKEVSWCSLIRAEALIECTCTLCRFLISSPSTMPPWVMPRWSTVNLSVSTVLWSAP